MRFNIENGILREYPQPMGVENVVERIGDLKGNFKGVMVRNDNPSDVSKKAQKSVNRNFIKLSIHYAVLGNKPYTEEEIAEFEAKGDRPNLEIISKNLREYNGVMYFYARYNKNHNLHSKVIYVDTNTNEVFTKQQMIEQNLLNASAINNNRGDYDIMKFKVENICEI